MKKIITIPIILVAFQANADIPTNLDLVVKGGNNRNYGQASAFIPLMEKEELSLLFGDVRFMHHLPNFKKSKKNDSKLYEVNLGLGYREAINSETVVGGAAFLDVRRALIKNYIFKQTTLNAHYLTSTWQSQFNIYIPLGKNKVTKITDVLSNKAKIINRDVFIYNNKATITEKALKGVDLRISNIIPNNENIRLGLVAFHFGDKKYISGGGVELEWKIADNFNIESSYTYDKTRKHNYALGFRYSVPIGKKNNNNKINKLLSTRVMRDIDIIVSENKITKIKPIKQDNFLVIHNSDLDSINNSGQTIENLNILLDLKSSYNSNKKFDVIIADNGAELDLSKVTKISNEEFIKNIDQIKDIIAQKLAAGESIQNIIDEALKEENSYDRKIKLLAANLAFEKNNINKAYIGGKIIDFDNHDQILNLLFKQYGQAKSTANRSFIVNLPGYPNAVIERAGTLLVVKDNPNALTIEVILGTDNNSVNKYKGTNTLPIGSWFSGQAEDRDQSIYHTLLRETFEESAGGVYISEKDFNDAIAEGRFIYNPHFKILTIIHPDVNYRYKADNFNNRLNAFNQNNSINPSFKEINHYYPIQVSDFLAVPNNIINNPSLNNFQSRFNKIYNIDTSKDGNLFRLDNYYARSISTPQGMSAIRKAVAKFYSKSR